MKNIYWVGIKESEIRSCRRLFNGSVTFIGSGKNGNISYSSEYNYTINYNEDSKELDQFMEKSLLGIIEKDPASCFFCYTASYIFSFENPEITRRIICGNARDILQMLRNKMNTRIWLGKSVPVLPTIALTGPECRYENLHNLFPDIITFTIQGCTGAGGADTYIMTRDNESIVYSRLYRNHLYLVSPFLEKSYSANIHVIFDDSDYVIMPGSIQIVEPYDQRMIYRGADFIEYNRIPYDVLEQIHKYTDIIASKILSTGYKGVLGIDYLVSKDSVFFLEINPRFQSSTPLLNLALKENELPTVQEILIEIFKSGTIPKLQNLSDITVEYSNYITDYVENEYDYAAYIDNIKQSDEIAEILWDGYSLNTKCQPGASIFSLTFSTNIVSLTHNGEKNIYDNIRPYALKDFSKPTEKLYQWLKIALMNQGIHFSPKALKLVETFQKGVYSSLDIYLNDNFIVNCPIDMKYHTLSPFKIDAVNDNLVLFYGSNIISNIKITSKKAYCNQITSNGISFTNISFIATDRLRIHHSPACIFQQNGVGCRFCDVPGKATNFTMADIKEVIDWHLMHSDFRHFLIGGASGVYPQEYKNILEIIKYIRAKSDKSIYIMSLPPEDLSVLDQYHSAGANEIAFNIEVYNRVYAQKSMPGKSNISLEVYKKALLHSVKLWGNTGNVRSILIYGLEPDEDFINGIIWLASNGIQPIISPFRALRGTLYESEVPPNTDKLLEIYEASQTICNKNNLELGPSCIYCQNNTLSFNPQMSFDFHI